MPKPITPEYLAALAAGIDLEAEESTEAAAAAAKAEADALVAAEAEAAAAAAAAVPTVESLQAELAVAQGAVASALAEVASFQAQITELTAAQAGLLAFARNSIKAMSIALKTGVSAVEDSEVLAEHARVSDLFKARFKVDGVAATKSGEPQGKPKAALMNPLFVHAVKSSQSK